MKTIKFNLIKNAYIREIISNIRNNIFKFIMIICNNLIGIKSNKVVFISFSGKSYSDNPRAISEVLYRLYPGHEIIWIFNDIESKKNIIPKYVKCVKNHSLKALIELSTAKIWVDNFCKPKYVYKSKNQKYIQTWHGDRGFKKILHDSPFVSQGYSIVEEKYCDLAIAGSEYGKMQYQSAFKYKGNILLKGTPRNDILINDISHKTKKIIKDSFNIKTNTKILLYAPTLRREAENNSLMQSIGKIDLDKILKKLESNNDEEWICMIRSHSAVKGIDGIPINDKFIDVSDYEDMSEILLISDILITDYSSSSGDFALLKRPIILFQEDRDEYIKKDRTFYFDIDKSPYFIAKNQREVIDIIDNIDNISKIIKNCNDILEFYGTNETGKASEEVVKYIVEWTQKNN